LHRRIDVETLPFDPAEFLDTEEAIAAYLADARLDGAVALSRAVEVVARARALIASVPNTPTRNVAEPAATRFSPD